MSSPCHIELVLSERDAAVAAAGVRSHDLERQCCIIHHAEYCLHLPVMASVGVTNRAQMCLSLRWRPDAGLRNGLQDDGKERKLSKREAAKKLRSGTKSVAAV